MTITPLLKDNIELKDGRYFNSYFLQNGKPGEVFENSLLERGELSLKIGPYRAVFSSGLDYHQPGGAVSIHNYIPTPFQGSNLTFAKEGKRIAAVITSAESGYTPPYPITVVPSKDVSWHWGHFSETNTGLGAAMYDQEFFEFWGEDKALEIITKDREVAESLKGLGEGQHGQPASYLDTPYPQFKDLPHELQGEIQELFDPQSGIYMDRLAVETLKRNRSGENLVLDDIIEDNVIEILDHIHDFVDSSVQDLSARLSLSSDLYIQHREEHELPDKTEVGVADRTVQSYPKKSVVFAIGSAWVDTITAKMLFDLYNAVPENETNPIVQPFLEEFGSAGFFYAASAWSAVLAGIGLLPIPKKFKPVPLIATGLFQGYASLEHLTAHLTFKGVHPEIFGAINKIMIDYYPSLDLLQKLF